MMTKEEILHNEDQNELKVTEIYYSIQGESTYTGEPCFFIRLTGCNLRCTWCDTEYGFKGGEEMQIDAIIAELKRLAPNCKLAEVTGGEPLMQDNCSVLVDRLLAEGYTVLVETGGSYDISVISEKAVRIVDVKCPDSGMHHRNDFENMNRLTRRDEVKFVIASRKDYDWSKTILKGYDLSLKCKVLFSPVFGSIELKDLAEWIIEDQLDVRLQMQLHKVVWDPEKKGV